MKKKIYCDWVTSGRRKWSRYNLASCLIEEFYQGFGRVSIAEDPFVITDDNSRLMMGKQKLAPAAQGGALVVCQIGNHHRFIPLVYRDGSAVNHSDKLSLWSSGSQTPEQWLDWNLARLYGAFWDLSFIFNGKLVRYKAEESHESFFRQVFRYHLSVLRKKNIAHNGVHEVAVQKIDHLFDQELVVKSNLDGFKEEALHRGTLCYDERYNILDLLGGYELFFPHGRLVPIDCRLNQSGFIDRKIYWYPENEFKSFQQPSEQKMYSSLKCYQNGRLENLASRKPLKITPVLQTIKKAY